jgi:predicted nucleic acid-binding protein
MPSAAAVTAVVADANVLLSAAIGKAALRVFTDHRVTVHDARFNTEEVRRYLPRLADRYRLPIDLVELQWHLLPLILHPPADYAGELTRARRELAGRDPDDAHPLALARRLGLPLWSNDLDLAGHGVACYPTARLLAVLAR